MNEKKAKTWLIVSFLLLIAAIVGVIYHHSITSNVVHSGMENTKSLSYADINSRNPEEEIKKYKSYAEVTKGNIHSLQLIIHRTGCSTCETAERPIINNLVKKNNQVKTVIVVDIASDNGKVNIPAWLKKIPYVENAQHQIHTPTILDMTWQKKDDTDGYHWKLNRSYIGGSNEQEIKNIING